MEQKNFVFDFFQKNPKKLFVAQKISLEDTDLLRREKAARSQIHNLANGM